MQYRPVTYPEVDILRGFAAISVIIYHVIEHFNWQSFPIEGPFLWFRIGWLGVDLFFVISGFVISLAAFAMLDQMEPSRFRTQFFSRRLNRIAPLHFLTCLLFLIAIRPELLFVSGTVENVIAHGLFFHNLRMDWAGAINGPNWSVAVEMQFYLLIMVSAPFLRRCRWWLIPVICVPIALGWRYFAIQQMQLDGPLGPYPRFWLSTQLPGTLDQFAMGVLLARFVVAGGLDRLRERVGVGGALFGAVGLATLCLYAALSLFWPRASFWDVPEMVLFWRTFVAFSFAVVVLASCLVRIPTRWNILVGPLRYLGTISYGLYLWHLLVLESVKRIDWVEGSKALPFVLVLTVLLAAGSWHFFEKPFIDRRRLRAVQAT